MKTKTIRQSVSFKASPHEIYEALMDSRKHSEFSGSKAKVSRKIRGKFSFYDGSLSGTNVQLVANKKIVQSWRCEMENWPKNHFSKAIFSLKSIKSGTHLNFTQSGVPEACYRDIDQGWHSYYWKPMKKWLEK